MFIISKDHNAGVCLESLVKQLSAVVESHKVFRIKLEQNLYLFWSSVKPQDNLHVFTNGIVIGRVVFSESISHEPIYHSYEVPDSFHTLIHNCVILFDKDLIVSPSQHMIIHYSKDSISDSQLLIAKAEKLMPDLMNVTVLACVGYFPGNLTLFSEIRRIAYLHQLRFFGQSETAIDTFEVKKSNDADLIRRYQNIVPKDVNSAIALSAGLDSRFVLGILLSKNIIPSIYSVKSEESIVAEKIAKRLNAPFMAAKSEVFDEYNYTLLSDARIYYRGGNYSQLRESFKQNEILHNGLFADPVIGDAFKTAWKKPGTLKTIFEDLIEHALLSNVKSRIAGLKNNPDTNNVREYLSERLAYQKEYFDFKKRKEWGGWFYHINRGLNWTIGNMADASFFTYPVFLLGDKEAVEMGLSSSAYSNFYKERLRQMNQSLYPDGFNFDYSNGRPFKSNPPVIRDMYKIYYEYGIKLVSMLSQKKKVFKGTGNTMLNDITFDQANAFSSYFTRDLKSNIKDPAIHFNFKRTMVTVNNVLKFLEN